MSYQPTIRETSLHIALSLARIRNNERHMPSEVTTDKVLSDARVIEAYLRE